MTLSIGPAPSVAASGRLVAERLSDRLAALLSAQIQRGELHPGDRLPTEQQLAVAHGVSRTVVREAVHQLKSRGLLLSRQGSGVYVAVPPRHRPLAFDPTVLESVDAVVHVIEVRRVLEGEIAAIAAQRSTRTQIAGLKRALAAIEDAVAAGRDGVTEDLAFHRAIAEATGNPQFARLLGFFEQYLVDAMRITRGNEARHADFMDQVRREHEAIRAAIAARDAAQARRCATQHILHGEQRLVVGGVIRSVQARAARTPARRAAAGSSRIEKSRAGKPGVKTSTRKK